MKEKTYFVSIPIHASYITYVEAKSKKEAKQMALDEMPATVCHQCSNHVELHDWNDKAEIIVEISTREK